LVKECIWLEPEAVANLEFLEWAGAAHLRHTKLAGTRDDKDPRKVAKAT
jgi:ATP-dependent DNA ligase